MDSENSVDSDNNTEANDSSVRHQLQQLRPKQQNQRQQQAQRICRCCLAAEDEEPQQLTQFVSLDTAAMVNFPFGENSAAKSGAESDGEEGEVASVTTLLDCLNGCARIGASMADKELPLHICVDCCQALESCCEFIRCVRNADQILRAKMHAKRQREIAEQLALEEAEERRKRLAMTDACEPQTTICVNSSPACTQKRANTRRTSACDHQPHQRVTSTSTNDSFMPRHSQNNNNNSTRSDSGIEIDEDVNKTPHKSPLCKPNSKEVNYYLEEYEGHTYVVPLAAAQELKRFHQSAKCALNKYKCGFCIHQCATQQQLNQHLQKHLGSTIYRCQVCNFACRFRFLLTNHEQNAHGISTIGDINYAATNNNDAQILIATTTATSQYSRTPAKYSSNQSKQYSSHSAQLQKHLRTHNESYRCASCSFKDTTREAILEHMAQYHKLYVDQQLAAQFIPLKNSNIDALAEVLRNAVKQFPKPILKENKQRRHLCQSCGNCYDRRFQLLKHEFKVHKKPLVAPPEKQQHKILKVEPPKLVQLKVLQPPKIARANNISFECSDCQDKVIFKKQEELMQHKRLVHTATKFLCNICQAEFLFSFELKYHMNGHLQQRGDMDDAWNCAEDASALNSMHLTKKDANMGANLMALDGEKSDEKEATNTRRLSLASLDTNSSESFLSSLVASPSGASDNNNFNICNINDQLYLNDFDLGLLDCNVNLSNI